MKKIFVLSGALMMSALTFTSCNNDDDKSGDETEFAVIETAPVVDEDNYSLNTTAANYSVKNFGESAVDGCADVVSELEAANTIIGSAKLSEAQEAYLREVLKNLVNEVIVPTYTKLADNTEGRRSTDSPPAPSLRLRLMRPARISRLPVCTGSRARLSLVVQLLISISTQPSIHGLSTVHCCSAISTTV